MKFITLLLLFLSGSLAQRKFLETKEADLDVTPQRPTGRGRARFTKTEEFRQVSTDYEKASRNDRQRPNYDIPRQPQNRRLYEVEEILDDIPDSRRFYRPSKVITEDKFEITNPQTRPQLFDPVPQYSPGKTKQTEIKYELPIKLEPTQNFETTSEAKEDNTEISSEISKSTAEISSSTSTTTTTTTTIKPTTKNTSGRIRGRNGGSNTVTSTTTISSRTRGQRKPAARQNIGGVETISEPPRTNFRVGRRRPTEQNSLKGKGPSVLDGADNPARSRNERTANAAPAVSDKVDNPIRSRNVNPNSRRKPVASSSTTPSPKSSTSSPVKRTREKRPESSTESRSPSSTFASRRNAPTRLETTTSPKSVERSSRGRSRSRFVEAPKNQPSTEPTTTKAIARSRESRQRHTVINEELASSSTVENPIRILAPVATETVTQKIESRIDTLKPNEIIQVSDLDAQKNKARVKETVTSEVSEVISTRKVTRRRKVGARNQNNNAPTKIKIDVDLNLDEDDIDNLNYPPQYKAILAAKAKGLQPKNKKDQKSSTEKLEATTPSSRPTRRRTSTKSPKKGDNGENRKAPVTKPPRKTFERSTATPASDNSTKQKYHARFREVPAKENEKKISPSFTKPQPGSRNSPPRKPGKPIEDNRIGKSNGSSNGTATQAPIVQYTKKSNRYSSRYRGETRDSPIRTSTHSPVYTPTIPTITPHYQEITWADTEPKHWLK